MMLQHYPQIFYGTVMPVVPNVAWCIGNFDGIHAGHQALLQQAVAAAAPQGVGLVTIYPHPRRLYSIYPWRMQWQLMHHYGVKYVHILPFLRIKNWKSHDFEEYLRQKYPHSVHVGEDFCYGHQRQGNATHLQKKLPAVHIMPDVCINNARVSSGRVRDALQQGNMALAMQLLQRPYTIKGLVRYGRQLGQKLGVPTANILWPSKQLLPRFGVYVARAQLPCGAWHRAVVNIGQRPTIDTKRSSSVVCEVHVIAPQIPCLYGRTLSVNLYQFLRPEQRFDSLTALKSAIYNDIAQAANASVDLNIITASFDNTQHIG